MPLTPAPSPSATPSRQSGFILLYVVGMLAAMAALILHSQLQRSASPRMVEKQLQQAIETQEIDELINLLLEQDKEQFSIDPRYGRYQAFVANRRLEDIEQSSELALLKSMLAQVGFKIDLEEARKSALKQTDDVVSPRPDGRPPFPLATGSHRLQLGEHSYTVQVEAGNARPNLNAIPYDPLWRLLKHLGLSENDARQLAANIIDWRDADNFKTDGIGQESDHYRSLVPGYSAANKALRSWQELAWIDGISPERLNLLRNNFSLGGNTSRYATLFAHLDAEKIAALIDIPASQGYRLYSELRQAELEPYSETSENPIERVIDSLGQDEQTRFRAAVTWSAETDTLRLTFHGSASVEILDYDTHFRRPPARW